MTVTLSPEDVKKYTTQVHEWELRRIQRFMNVLRDADRGFGSGIDWKMVTKTAMEYDEPFPNLYQILGL